MKFKPILIILIVLILLIILIQNTKVVDVQLLFWKISMSRVILLLLTFLAGIITGFIVSSLFRKYRIEKK